MNSIILITYCFWVCEKRWKFNVKIIVLAIFSNFANQQQFLLIMSYFMIYHFKWRKILLLCLNINKSIKWLLCEHLILKFWKFIFSVKIQSYFNFFILKNQKFNFLFYWKLLYKIIILLNDFRNAVYCNFFGKKWIKFYQTQHCFHN